MQDLRFALRQLAQSPGFAAVIVLSFAAGIGANTVVFSWIQAVFFDPLPGVERGARLMVIDPHDRSGSYLESSWLDYREVRDQQTSFREIAAARIRSLNLGGTPSAVVVMIVRQGLQVVAVGAAVGLLAAYGFSIYLSPRLVAVPAGDSVVFLAIPALLGAVALLACWLPARRAAWVDPVKALRTE